MKIIKDCVLIILWAVFFALVIFIFLESPFYHGRLFKKSGPLDVYAYIKPGMLSPRIKKDLYRVYVPNSFENTVSIIDPVSYKVIGKFITGKNPQHITPSYDLRNLFVLNNLGNSLTPINPATGAARKQIPVYDPYNMYYTPDGHFALVLAEAANRIDFRDPKTLQLIESVPLRCNGVNHMDFTADGNQALLSCEFSGELVRLDVKKRKVISYLNLDSCAKKHSMPQDVRLSPDGKTFYIADMMCNGVFMVDAQNFLLLGFIATGKGAHSIYPSRNSKYLYVANRGCNTVSGCSKKGPGDIAVIDANLQKVVDIWPIAGGGSPDMGNLTPDGKELWLAGRYDGEVYVFDTQSGRLKHRIPVGKGPHGLTIWPQPGRYSLGHTGNMR